MIGPTVHEGVIVLDEIGYELEWVAPVDMFPQTFHIEPVGRNERRRCAEKSRGLPGRHTADGGETVGLPCGKASRYPD